MDLWALRADALKVVGGALLGFFLGWVGPIFKEHRERSQLRDALYQEIANCYEAISYHISPSKEPDFTFLKTKLKDEMVFIAFEAASRSASGLYKFPEHGWIIGCYRELKKLTALTAESDDNELVFNILPKTMGMIDNVPNKNVKKRLLAALDKKFHEDVHLTE